MDFTRDPGPLVLPGFLAQTSETLQFEIKRAGLEASWVAADLSLGAWRGHQVALEFCSQLGIDLPRVEVSAREKAREDRNIEIAYADIVGEFIDAEALGDLSTIASLQFASRIRETVLRGIPRVFLVIAPRYGLPWEGENILFIRLFAQALKGTRSVLVLIATGESDPEIPPDWMVTWRGSRQASPAIARDDIVGLIPGVVCSDLVDTLQAAGLVKRGDLIPLAMDHWLVAPERRRTPTAVSRLEFDRLGGLASGHRWLDAYAQYYGNNLYVEPWLLYAEAQRRFAEGGSGITLRLMERAITQVRVGLDWGILQAYAQGLRVALHRFGEAAEIVDPPAALSVELRVFLLQCKGWGLVMMDEVSLAEECFRQARELTDTGSRDRREYLYLLNISALCRLKAGEVESALALEKEIEERRARLLAADRRLHYVNSINIARIHRSRGELDEASRYFRDAFSTTLGARSESDAVHANVVMARLHTASGKHAKAFTCWMRAAIHWAASDAPEALGGRLARHILGKALQPGANLPEAIAGSLASSVHSAAAASGLADVLRNVPTLGSNEGLAPTFVRAESARRRRSDAPIDCALLNSGVSVFGMRASLSPQVIGENSMRLKALLYELLEALAPPRFLTGIRTIVVDDLHGREMPATPDELIAACVRLGVRDVAIEGGVMSLSRDERKRIERSLRAHVGCAVENVAFDDGRASVFFKRYFHPIVLTLEESGLLSLAVNGQKVDEILNRYEETASRDHVLEMLRALEQKRVVNLDSEAVG